jgi:L-ribulose-5-phosphate 4-epimerase
MSYQTIKQATYDLNMSLQKSSLVTLTFGNASVVDRAADGGEGVMAIKPSGIPYTKLTPNDIVVLSLSKGEILEGSARPSSDTPTHLHLHQSFPHIAAIIHTHSTNATAFAQAHRTIHCLGTTHADHFYGTVPVTRQMTPEEIADAYELNTGKVIVETFRELGINPDEVPAVLVASHAPFVWGKSPEKTLENAIALEAIATMQLGALQLNPNISSIPQVLLDKHFKRKHGPNAYYGQKT